MLLRWCSAQLSDQDPVLFSGHLDVVPGGDGWTVCEPFDGLRQEGRIYGRGAVDSKGVVIAMLEAAESLIADGYTPKRDLYFAFGADEESGGKRGAKAIAEGRQPLGFAGSTADGEAEMRRQVREELRRTFRPEFLNRIDETIIFHRLGQEDLLQIARLLLGELEERFSALGMRLQVPEDCLRWLVGQLREESYGARPLRRTIQQHIEDPAAELLLEGAVLRGGKLEARLQEERLVLSPV
mgnify:CR=1 FL=1